MQVHRWSLFRVASSSTEWQPTVLKNTRQVRARYHHRSKVIKKLLAYRYHLYYLTRYDRSRVLILPPSSRRILHSCRSVFHSATRRMCRGYERRANFPPDESWKIGARQPGAESIRELIRERRFWKASLFTRLPWRSSAPPSFYLLSSTLFTEETSSSSSSRRDKFPHEDAPLCGTARTDPPPPTSTARRLPRGFESREKLPMNRLNAFTDRIEASWSLDFTNVSVCVKSFRRLPRFCNRKGISL